MTNSFIRHGIEHLSPSTLNTWAAQPAIVVLEKLLHRRGNGVSMAALRGTASEAGIVAGLMDPHMDQVECQDIALREFDREFWLRVWRQGYNELSIRRLPVVVDDVRLEREVEYLREVDPTFLVVRLYADPEARAHRLGGSLLGSGEVTERSWHQAPYDLTLDTTSLSVENVYREVIEAAGGTL